MQRADIFYASAATLLPDKASVYSTNCASVIRENRAAAL